jgi:hypothetical protein
MNAKTLALAGVPARQLLFAGVLLVLAACGPAPNPQIIATFPQAATPRVVATYVPAPPYLMVVYDASLEIEVNDPIAAAETAKRVVYDRGGYVTNAQSWVQDGRAYATLTLMAPVARFDDARRALRDLGTVVNETVSERLIDPGPGYDGWNTYTSITVRLRQPAAFALPPAPSLPSGWSPLRTFESAFAVTAAIFRVVIDILIWVIVVAGPFVMVALIARAWWRRRRARP